VAGKSADGRTYIDAAVSAGAGAVLVEADGWAARECGAPTLAVSGLRAQLGALAAAFYRAPSAELTAIGVTGTNGKTSCSQWIAQLLTHAGRRCAVIGTVGSGFTDAPLTAAQLTTPDPIGLQREVRRLRDAGAEALAMEVSSIGLDQGRADGMQFDVALFTNLTRDHLDYHGTMQAYEAAKQLLFDVPTLTCAVLNLDDAAGERLRAHLQRTRPALRVIGTRVAAGGEEQAAVRGAHGAAPSARLDAGHSAPNGATHSAAHNAAHNAVPTSALGASHAATSGAVPRGSLEELRAHNVRATATGMAFTLAFGVESIDVAVPLVGQFNVANLLGVVGVALACGIDFKQACALLPKLVPPPGRMQFVGGTAAPLAVIDYAHTPDALAQALAALRPVAHARNGALWAVFGAGGDRDPGKRALMGAEAARAADRVVITSDNPRSENPAAIVAAIATAAPGAQQVVDRAQAIHAALMQARDADVVLIAGKGHEDYQEVHGVKRHFSDVEQAAAALAERAGASSGADGGASGGTSSGASVSASSGASSGAGGEASGEASGGASVSACSGAGGEASSAASSTASAKSGAPSTHGGAGGGSSHLTRRAA
jgi:UDP-N-acetylmuramoyl-L-alanyl-D-glutamate--2,6-diaminopimelate ligase